MGSWNALNSTYNLDYRNYRTTHGKENNTRIIPRSLTITRNTPRFPISLQRKREIVLGVLVSFSWDRVLISYEKFMLTSLITVMRFLSNRIHSRILESHAWLVRKHDFSLMNDHN